MKAFLQIPAMTSLPSNLTAEKSMKMTFSSDKIYYNVSQGNPKITNVENPHRRYTYFKQMYVDVDFRETLAYDQLIGLGFTEFVHRQMLQLEERETACVKTETDHGPWTRMKECCEITDEDDRWLTYADKAISIIDRDDIWPGSWKHSRF